MSAHKDDDMKTVLARTFFLMRGKEADRRALGNCCRKTWKQEKIARAGRRGTKLTKERWTIEIVRLHSLAKESFEHFCPLGFII
jgi:hypothetical protein